MNVPLDYGRDATLLETRPPHVVMLCGNDVSIDTRVKKIAITTASSGLRVTVLGLSSTGLRTEGMLGPARILRVPVPWILKRHRSRSLSASLSRGMAYASKEDFVAARRRQKIRERELAAAVGRYRARYGLQAEEPKRLRDVVQQKITWSTLKATRLTLKARRKVQQIRESLYRQAIVDLADQDRGRRAARPIRPPVPIRPNWRKLAPEIDDYELAFGPVLDELDPDIIHAHDVHMIGIAERAVARAANRGRTIRWIYDAHENVPGLARSDKLLTAFVALEAEYIRSADRIITVSEPLADLLQRRYDLPARPAVVMNIPIRRKVTGPHAPSLREAAGLEEEVPIMVYSGGIHPSRGVETCIDAMPHLQDVYLVLVSNRTNNYTRGLEERARELGCEDRLRIVPFVPPDEVSTYLSSATVALNPLLHYGNYEVALPNKYFEYLHAGLPVVNSDVEATMKLTRDLHVGEVFTAGDPVGLAAAVRKVLEDRDSYVNRISSNEQIRNFYTWERQEQSLLEVYSDLLGEPLGSQATVDSLAEVLDTSFVTSGRRSEFTSLGIGPRNMAGQGWEWAKAIRRLHPQVRTEVFALEKQSPLLFPTDVRIPASSWKSLEWQLAQVRHVLTHFTHLLLESGNGLLGTLNGSGFFTDDVAMLRAHDIRLGLVLHGSEVRDPRRHRMLEPYSPFADPSASHTARVQAAVDTLRPLLQEFDGPTFVTTLDLLDYVPDARWLPVVVDFDQWDRDRPLLHRTRPVVAHIPSNSRMKGSPAVDEAAREMAQRGLIEYRRFESIPPNEMPQVVADIDVLLDQFAVGDYGVTACQAMAAGRVVVGHVAERVRQRLPDPLPIVEATLDTLQDVLAAIAASPHEYRHLGSDSRAYAKKYHDGGYAVRQLDAFLGIGASRT